MSLSKKLEQPCSVRNSYMNKLDLYRTLKHSETNGVVDAFACNCNKYKKRVHDSQTHIHFMYCVVVAMMLLMTQKKT